MGLRDRIASALGLPPVTGRVEQEQLDEAAIEATDIRHRLDKAARQESKKRKRRK